MRTDDRFEHRIVAVSSFTNTVSRFGGVAPIYEISIIYHPKEIDAFEEYAHAEVDRESGKLLMIGLASVLPP